MYKIFKSRLFQIILITLICCGCYEDLGNYDLKDINEVTIEGISNSYTVLLGKNLTISPTLRFSQDDKGDLSRYSFRWYTVEDLTTDVVRELGTSKDVDATINYAPKTYKAYYVVTDNQTGVAFQKSFDVVVESQIGKGWLVLSEVNGGSRLDMIPLFNNQYTVIHDVLGEVHSSLHLTGTPKDITCIPQSAIYGIYVSTTGNGTTRIDPETFDWQPTYQVSYRMLAGSLPTDFMADFIHPVGFLSFTSSNSSYLYKDGDVYFGGSYYYDVLINQVIGVPGSFKAAPYLLYYQSNGYLYDTEKRRFLHHYSGNLYCKLIDNSLSTKFDYNNTGMDLAYMCLSWYNNVEVFAILKTPDNSKYYLARFKTATKEQLYYAEMTATDITQATGFAVSLDYGYVFYAVGGKVYEYDFSLRTSKLMIDKGASEITYLSSGGYFTMPDSKPNDLQRKLIVGTYDPSGPEGSNGTLELYSIPPVNGDVVLEQQYTGFGKIVDIAYRQRP